MALDKDGVLEFKVYSNSSLSSDMQPVIQHFNFSFIKSLFNTEKEVVDLLMIRDCFEFIGSCSVLQLVNVVLVSGNHPFYYVMFNKSFNLSTDRSLYLLSTQFNLQFFLIDYWILIRNSIRCTCENLLVDLLIYKERIQDAQTNLQSLF
jgi:hypothetical protein